MNCSACGAQNEPGHRFCSQCGASLAPVCPNCGSEVPAGARFCPSCGSSLESTTAEEPSAGAEERKIITVLFADLVGFTAHTEQSDPEDVRARLTVYHRHIREDVERFGGRIEKLMGDGAFAVFGAPVAHEDDPERAVRAALRIQQSVDRLNQEHPDLALSVRIAVTTGQAVVQLDTTDQDREGIIGDVVNTASRLESVASAGEVVVDERTYLASRGAVEYRALDPVVVKGKEHPIAIWEAAGARSRFGVAVEDESATPFVGRQTELSLLVDAFDRTVRERAVQLVTIAGEPGVGKSRLLREFRGVIDERPDLVWWRQGRCLPYGEGITFWALGEIIKAQAGILESETAGEALTKLASTVSDLIDDRTKADWIRARLGPLVGTGASEDVAQQSELFKAWLEFFEALAARNPLIVLIEDAHWADQPLLDFLEHVIDWAVDAPILLVVTARPELFTDHPDWGGGKRNAATIALAPLSDGDTAALLTAMLPRSVMPADAQQAILERCGGNPLYVTEFVRYAADRDMIDELSTGREIPLPDSVQALIAARLDLLDHEDKALLQTAAVVGRVFWTAVISFMRPELEASASLRRLIKRELIRPVRDSSMRGQEEFKFFHSLIQDVAYGQIPRAERAVLHEAAARWLEAVSGERAVDVAELLAFHLSEALALSSASDDDLAERAYRFIMLAGERAKELDASRGAEYFRRAAEIAPRPGDEGRALLELARVTQDTDLLDRSLEQAYEVFASMDDREGMARARAQQAGIAWWRGDADAMDRLGPEAVSLIEDAPISAAKAEVMVGRANALFLRGMAEEALDAAERARPIVDAAGSVTDHIRLLSARGGALCNLGDTTGIEAYREALRIAEDRNLTRQAITTANNLATVLGIMEGPREALVQIDGAIRTADERGYLASADWNRMTKCELLYPAGAWDEILDLVDAVLARDQEVGGSQASVMAKGHRANVLFMRGRLEEVRRLVSEMLPAARDIKDQQLLAPTLSGAISVAFADGDVAQARQLINEYEEVTSDAPGFRSITIGEVAEPLAAMGLSEQLERLIDGAREMGMSGAVGLALARGHLASAKGDVTAAVREFTDAAHRAEAAGARLPTAVARIGAGRCLVEGGRLEEARPLLAAARADAEAMGAVRLLAEVDAIEGRADGDVARA